MYGQNRQEKQLKSAGDELLVNSMFLTIQGEGPYAGRVAVFVRLSGCPLRCTWCDTDFETKEGQQPIRLQSILNAVDGLSDNHKRTSLVVITGGEPMRQNIYKLVQQLAWRGYKMQVETSGVYWVPNFEQLTRWSPVGGEPPCTIVVSPKTRTVHEAIRQYADYWKYIIRAGMVSETDGLPVGSTQPNPEGHSDIGMARPPRHLPRHKIYVQPCDEKDLATNKANMEASVCLAETYGYSISMQMHKILGVD